MAWPRLPPGGAGFVAPGQVRARERQRGSPDSRSPQDPPLFLCPSLWQKATSLRDDFHVLPHYNSSDLALIGCQRRARTGHFPGQTNRRERETKGEGDQRRGGRGGKKLLFSSTSPPIRGLGSSRGTETLPEDLLCQAGVSLLGGRRRRRRKESEFPEPGTFELKMGKQDARSGSFSKSIQA